MILFFVHVSIRPHPPTQSAKIIIWPHPPTYFFADVIYGRSLNVKISVKCEDAREIDVKSFFDCLEKKHGKYVLHEAARDGDLKLVKYLQKNGVNLITKNNKGTTPILLAAINGHFRVVKYLHKHGYLGKIDITGNKNGSKSLREIHLHNHFPISVRFQK